MKKRALDILDLVGSQPSAVTEAQPVNEGETTYRPELVEGYEPDFIPGYSLKCGGHSIDVKEITKAVKRNENVLLFGETGTGKSTIGSRVFDDLNSEILEENRKIHDRNLPLIDAGLPVNKLEKYNKLQYTRVLYNGHIGTRTEHMIGTIDIQYNEKGERQAVRVPGFLSFPFITPGHKLLWDEVDITLPEVLGEAHPYLDGRSSSIDVFLNGHWHLVKQKDFSVIATANTVGAGENQMDYAGTNVLNRAFLDRFGFFVKVEYLPHDEEVNMVMRKVPGFRRDVVDHMVASANETRAAKANGAVSYSLSPRNLISWARACMADDVQPSNLSTYWIDIAMKYIYTSFLNRIPDEAVREAYSTYFHL